MEANWHPQCGVVLPQRQVAAELGMRRSTVAKAIACLLENGLIILKSAAVKPNTMGGGTGRGQAAVYGLPHRIAGNGIRFDRGDKRLPGYWKVYCRELRQISRQLSNSAARVLLMAAALPRDRNGTLLNQHQTVELTGDQLARDLPGLSDRTARRAVNLLAEKGLVRVLQPSAGQRGARYQP